MFINIENGKVVLYELRIYKKFNDVQLKLKYDSPYEYMIEKSTWYSQEHRDGKDYRILQSYKKIGVVEYNDLYSSDEDLFECNYLVYHLNKVYLMLDCIENNKYSKLDLLNQYINGKIDDSSQILFDKYRKEILRSLRLVEILSLDITNFLDIYNLFLKRSDGEIKEMLEKLKKHFYSMELNNIPVLKLKRDKF